jgi:hypothetical protein
MSDLIEFLLVQIDEDERAALAEDQPEWAVPPSEDAAAKRQLVESFRDDDLTLWLLASAYADQPGYRDEWRP